MSDFKAWLDKALAGEPYGQSLDRWRDESEQLD